MIKQEFIKRIPEEFQQKIGLQRFKISLIKCKNQKQVDKVKTFLELKTKDIFENVDLQTKENATNYLKTSLDVFLSSENIKNFKEINNEIGKKFLIKKDVITIQSIIFDAIEKQDKNHNKKMEFLENNGVNTKIKINGTKLTYKSILNDINRYFGENYNIDNLTYDIVEKYASKFNNDSYISNLKSIFKKANNRNPNIINYFSKLETSSFSKFNNINEEINIFYYDEIQNILNILDEEKQFYFLTLLLTGMRNDELASIKKTNIKNDCFYFYDSKAYFSKIVPIHFSLLEYINNKIKDLSDNDYIFLKNNKSQRRVSQIRDKFNSLKEFKDIEKTLHNTRSTFVTYLNFHNKTFFANDIKALTHKVKGIDQEKYNKITNIARLREIVNSIDLKKLKEIEEQIEQMGKNN